jgi:YVTN family beta-propeller protein
MEFRILGPLEVVDDGRPVSIRRGKEQALLAYLLLHANEVLPSARLIDALWDERPPPTASKILQNAVSHLRKELGDGRLVTKDPGYVLRVDEGELDLQQFERLAKEGRAGEALALWRGTPFVGLREERFADDARRRLEEQRLAVLEDRIEGDLVAGRHAELVPELEQLVGEHPLHEELQGQLMRALYGAGRQADALEAYRQARRTLSEELGLEPGPQLQELERKILTQDPALAPPTPRRRSAPPATARPRRRIALVGLAAAAVIAGTAFGLVQVFGGDSGPLFATPNSLAVIDPGRNQLVKVIPVGNTPRGVAVGREFVWVANSAEGTLTQIDAKTLEFVTTIGIGAQASDLVEANGALWVATGLDNGLVHLDAKTGGELERMELSNDRSAGAHAVAAGLGAIWVASGREIVKIDPRTGRRRRFAAGHNPLCCFGGINDIAVGSGAIWIADIAELATRISPTTLRVTGSTELGSIPGALTIAYNAVWVVMPDPGAFRGTLWRIDPGTARVTQTTTVGPGLMSIPSLELTAGAGAIWVTNYDAGTVFRVDPASGHVVSTIRTGGHPAAITFGANRIWVTVR